jgi:hypothetical protein
MFGNGWPMLASDNGPQILADVDPRESSNGCPAVNAGGWHRPCARQRTGVLPGRPTGSLDTASVGASLLLTPEKRSGPPIVLVTRSGGENPA